MLKEKKQNIRQQGWAKFRTGFLKFMSLNLNQIGLVPQDAGTGMTGIYAIKNNAIEINSTQIHGK